QVEIRAFVEDTVDEQGLQNIENEMKELPEVKEVTFIPKAEGLENLRDSFGDNDYLLDGYEDANPLPNAYVVRVFTPEKVADVAANVAKISGIYKVNFGEDYVRDLLKVSDITQKVGIVFILGLTFTAMFLIANTIKITIMSRRREIEIQKLVGATNAFIRWPFFVEGLILGVLGSIVPIFVLIIGYQLIWNLSTKAPIPFIQLVPMNPLAYQISFLLLGIGAFIGIWGSMMSVRRFLKI
ncbi:MAG: permease-like cell division protein FtsX, partial [Bacilli bacterium]